MRANWEGRQVWVGGPRLLGTLFVQTPEPIGQFEQQANQKGQSAVYLVVLPLAAGVLAPAAGAALMSISTIIVAINAQLLKT